MPVLTRQKLHGFAAEWRLGVEGGALDDAARRNVIHHCLNAGRRDEALGHLVALGRAAGREPARRGEAVLCYSLLVQLGLTVDAFEQLEGRSSAPGHAAEAFLKDEGADVATFDEARLLGA